MHFLLHIYILSKTNRFLIYLSRVGTFPSTRNLKVPTKIEKLGEKVGKQQETKRKQDQERGLIDDEREFLLCPDESLRHCLDESEIRPLRDGRLCEMIPCHEIL